MILTVSSLQGDNPKLTTSFPLCLRVPYEIACVHGWVWECVQVHRSHDSCVRSQDNFVSLRESNLWGRCLRLTKPSCCLFWPNLIQQQSNFSAKLWLPQLFGNAYLNILRISCIRAVLPLDNVLFLTEVGFPKQVWTWCALNGWIEMAPRFPLWLLFCPVSEPPYPSVLPRTG